MIKEMTEATAIFVTDYSPSLLLATRTLRLIDGVIVDTNFLKAAKLPQLTGEYDASPLLLSQTIKLNSLPTKSIKEVDTETQPVITETERVRARKAE